jgi:hypothetical protein
VRDIASGALRAAALLIVAGIILFCGSLYALTFGAPRLLGRSPGRVAWIAGWLLFAWGPGGAPEESLPMFTRVTLLVPLARPSRLWTCAAQGIARRAARRRRRSRPGDWTERARQSASRG